MLIKDLTDGYFPYELKERYPDGVYLDVVDRRGDVYQQRDVFGGASLQLGGAPKPSKLLELSPAGARGTLNSLFDMLRIAKSRENNDTVFQATGWENEAVIAMMVQIV